MNDLPYQRGNITIRKQFNLKKTFFLIQIFFSFFFFRKNGLIYFLLFFFYVWHRQRRTLQGCRGRGFGREKKIYKKRGEIHILYYWAFTPTGAVVMVRASWTALRLADNL